MIFYRINEMAIGGTTGTSSIAANFGGGNNRAELRHGEHDWRGNVDAERADRAKIAKAREQLAKAKELKAKQQKEKPRFKNFVSRLLRRNVAEGMDIAGVTSQLKGLENKNNSDARNTVTYGVEDDEGNLMKVTVKSEDAKSFENRLALELGEVENNKIYGFQNSGVSLAEVLYTLKDEYDIVDVEFPEIPSDIVYNADKASLGEAQPDPTQEDPNAQPLDANGPDGQLGGPNGGMDDGGDGLPAPNFDEENPDEPLDDENGDMGEEFVDDDGGDDFKSLFKELVQLMTAQAEKEKAVADAEAEKARALQAEFTSKAANHEVSRQEELIRMQADMDQQKNKEKEAKRYADLAKYRVNKDRGSQAVNFEGYTSFLGNKISEDVNPNAQLDSDLEDETSIRKQMTQAKQKYQILPTDDQPTKDYKQRAYQSVNNQLQAKLKQIRDQKTYSSAEQAAAAAAAQAQTQQAQQQAQPQAGNGTIA